MAREIGCARNTTTKILMNFHILLLAALLFSSIANAAVPSRSSAHTQSVSLIKADKPKHTGSAIDLTKSTTITEVQGKNTLILTLPIQNRVMATPTPTAKHPINLTSLKSFFSLDKALSVAIPKASVKSASHSSLHVLDKAMSSLTARRVPINPTSLKSFHPLNKATPAPMMSSPVKSASLKWLHARSAAATSVKSAATKPFPTKDAMALGLLSDEDDELNVHESDEKSGLTCGHDDVVCHPVYMTPFRHPDPIENSRDRNLTHNESAASSTSDDRTTRMIMVAGAVAGFMGFVLL